MRLFASLLFSGGALVAAFPLAGQEEVLGQLSGRLLHAGAPADSGTVVLHHVTPDGGGAIDSVQVSAGGEFSFLLPNLPIPGSGEVFFAAAHYAGIAYLGMMIEAPAVLDSLYTIQTYPAVSAPPQGFAFPISVREIWIAEGAAGWQVTDVFDLSNPAGETIVPASDGAVVWRYPLPDGAGALRVMQAGLIPGTVVLEDGALTVSMPIVPGPNRIIVQYDMESLDFDIPLSGDVGVMRILMEEPLPPMRVEGLARMEPVELDLDLTFAHWAGQGLRDQVVAVRYGDDESRGSEAAWASILLALLLAAGGVWAVRRRAPSPLAQSTGKVDRPRSAVLLDIARLDEAAGSPEDRGSEYRIRRAALLRELDSEH